MVIERATDEELLQTRHRPSAGAAFGAFYARHEPLVVAYHQRRVLNAEVAGDLAAETFAQALAARYRFRAEGPGSAVRWLYGIASNVLRRSVRQAAVEQRKLERLRLERPSLDDAALAAIEAVGSDQGVMRALATLPRDQRQMIRAFVLDEAGYDEIAGALEIAPAAARKRVSRGLQNLRRDLEETR